MTTQEQMFPLVKFWESLFRHDASQHDTVDAAILAEFNSLFKQSKMASKIFSLKNLNRVLLLLTVMDDLFEVDIAQLITKSEAKRNERMR